MLVHNAASSALLPLLLTISSSHAVDVEDVPIVGGVTHNSAKVNFRLSDTATVKVEYCKDRYFEDAANCNESSAATPTSASDFTETIELTGLDANEVYYYRLHVDGQAVSNRMITQFKTFPDPDDVNQEGHTFKAVVISDTGLIGSDPYVYERGNEEEPLLALQIGDFPHYDPVSLDDARTMHKQLKDQRDTHGKRFAMQIASKMAFDHMWDDHDYCGQDSDKNCDTTPGSTLTRTEAVQAYHEHWPTYSNTEAEANEGIWHAFTVGKVRFIVLDCRSQRDPETINKGNLNKTMLGATQKAWLKTELADSTFDFKVIISTVTANDAARSFSIDHWRGFTWEADELKMEMDTMDDVVLITADIHTGGAIDDGTNSRLGIPEMNVAFTSLQSGNQGNEGTWSESVTAGNLPTGQSQGYGMITYDHVARTLTLEAKGYLGDVRHTYTLVKSGTTA